MGYFSRLKKIILTVFLVFGTLPLTAAGIYMIYLGSRAYYTNLVVAGIAAVVFAVAALTASAIIVMSRINPIETAADKLLDTFEEDEKEVIRLSSGKSPARFIGRTIDYLAGERMQTVGHTARQELFETASLCTGEIIWLREKKGDSYIIPGAWKERYEGLELSNGTALDEYVHPDDENDFSSAMQVVSAAAGRRIAINFRLRYGADNYIPVCAEVRSAETDGVVCTAASINDLRKLDELEASVKEKYLMYDFAVRAVTDIIYEMDTAEDSFTILSKERWNEMFDLPMNGSFSVHRSGYAGLIHPDYFKAFTERFSDYDHLMFMPEKTLSFDYLIKKKDGSWCPVRHTVVSVNEQNGHVRKIVGLITDLSGKKSNLPEVQK